jgi:7-cyano-7-deazaguanine synthase in queuosine biosynthesis
MKLTCAPVDYKSTEEDDGLRVILYGCPEKENQGSVGSGLKECIQRAKLGPAARAWDLLSIALSVTAADVAGHRRASPDGWTRQFELVIATEDPAFWNEQRKLVNSVLEFLTTDTWNVRFTDGGVHPTLSKAVRPKDDCVLLLSGGLDSLVGGIDLIASQRRPYSVSQVVVGEAENQRQFAQSLGGGLLHLQINHNVRVPDPESPPTQRARSLIFLAYGVLVATSLERYQSEDVALYVCENGFISVNPPLTGARLGSLSTRTTHPNFLVLVQKLLDTALLKVRIVNPYRSMTKGEMLSECRDQVFLRERASQSISCGRYRRFGHNHCGRCVPCLVRRAAFLKWGVSDHTNYIYQNLGVDDEHHARSDDVRAVAMALQEACSLGIQEWIGTALSTATLTDVPSLEAMIGRGLNELAALFCAYGVQ